MKRSTLICILACLCCRIGSAAPPAAEILGVTKIWDQAPHCAFTDLIHWNGQFVCAFREGRGHVSADGRIRVLMSPDGTGWKSAAVVSLGGYDLRDAGLSTTPDGRLMLIGGAAPRKADGDGAPTGSFVSFSKDGAEWNTPEIVSEPGRWLWRVTWHKDKAYGVAYAAGSKSRSSSLLESSDGIHYREVAPDMLDQGWPTEAVVRFGNDDTMYCLQRRDGKAPANTAMFGVSKPPYRDWQWTDLEVFFGGPNFIQIPSGQWIAAGRIVGAAGPKTELAALDMSAKKLAPFLQLPSGGDNSYPGLVWDGGVLWVSYYSSHEGKGSIYLAKVKLKFGDDAQANRDVTVPVRAVAATKLINLTAAQLASCNRLNLDEKIVQELFAKPLYKFSESEVDTYLQFLSDSEPDLRNRIIHLARKNVGQPYEIYLLGEAPYESHDPQPIYCLNKSDCLVFSEHTYAMALSHDWPSFMKMLQRLRYRDGKLGVVTRNHYTEADWNISNRWLVEDITKKLAGDKAVAFEQAIDRAKFFKNRYKLDVDVQVEHHKDQFIPFEAINQAKSELQDGDFVNIVRGTVGKDAPPSELSNTFGGNAWVGHVGMIAHGDDGEVHLIHSTQPEVREEPIDEYIARSTATMKEDDAKGKPRLLGFKFLRLRKEPMKNLRVIDGKAAPKVTLPDGSEAEFELVAENDG